MEPDHVPPDPYPHCLVDENGVRGSCSTFNTRKDVTHEAKEMTSAEEVMAKYGRQKLAIVASQVSLLNIVCRA